MRWHLFKTKKSLSVSNTCIFQSIFFWSVHILLLRISVLFLTFYSSPLFVITFQFVFVWVNVFIYIYIYKPFVWVLVSYLRKCTTLNEWHFDLLKNLLKAMGLLEFCWYFWPCFILYMHLNENLCMYLFL